MAPHRHGRGGWPATGLIRQPGLGLFQLATAQQQAAVATTGFPLTGLDEQPSVQVSAGKVGVQDLDELVNTGLEVGSVQERKPVQLGQCPRDTAVGGLAGKDRDETLRLLGRVVEFGSADFGGDRVRRDDKDDRVCLGDSGADLLHPVR
jgi:hypothetical protein